MPTKLPDLPKDIVLNVLYSLQVEDILSLERTCSFLRDIVATRHLWLVQLQLLNQPCAPNLPPHIEVEKLSYSELRLLTVNAVRGNRSWRKGFPINSDTQRTSVTVETALNTTDLSLNPDHFTTFLAPGGNYLFFANLRKDYLQAFDVHTNKLIWTYSKLGTSVTMLDFAVEVLPDASLIIMVLSMNMGLAKILFEVFRLNHPDDQQAGFVSIAAIEYQRARGNLTSLFQLCLAGSYAAVFSFSNFITSIIVVNWKTGQKTEIALGKSYLIRHMKIVDDHLIYILKDFLRGHKVGSFSCRQFGSASSVVNLMDIKAFSWDLRAPDGFVMETVSPISLYVLSSTGRRTTEIQAVVITKVYIEDEDENLAFFDVANHLAFDFQNEDSLQDPSAVLKSFRRSTPIEDRYSYMSSLNVVVCDFQGSITHSGRILAKYLNGTRNALVPSRIEPMPCFLGLDTQGGLYYTSLPAEICEYQREFSLEPFSSALVVTCFDLVPRCVEILYPT